VLAVNHRLAPEHPMPTPIYDGFDVAKTLAQNAEQYGIDPDAIYLSGVSSGGHCSVTIPVLLQDDPAFKIRRSLPVNGWYDGGQLQHDAQYDDYEAGDKMCTRDIAKLVFKHLHITPEQARHPLYSPVFIENITGLPPITFLMGEYDCLRSDNEILYKNLKALGADVEKVLLDGQTHNTLLLRGVCPGSNDPARIIAERVKQDLAS
jgi:acetyl esterase